MNERGLYRLFREAVARRLPNALYWKIPDTKGLGGKRMFDALLITQGRAYCIEFKVGRNPLAPHQAYWLKRAERAGGRAVVLTESTWRDFLSQLSKPDEQSDS